jgi:hypothetical protein
VNIARTRSEECLSDLAIDRHLAGETSNVAHAESCAFCSARIEALRVEKRVFPEQIGIVFAAKALDRRVRSHTIKRALVGVTSLAAAVLLAVIVLPPPEEGVRTKGGLSLEVIARQGDGSVTHLLPGANVSPGDAIRFRVRSEKSGYLAISGLDAAQVVSVYHDPMRIEGDAHDRLIEGSIILDRTLGPEQIAAIVCKEPMTHEQILALGKEALARAGGDPRRVSELGVECSQTFFLIEKVDH